jgi:hypothetical protein
MRTRGRGRRNESLGGRMKKKRKKKEGECKKNIRKKNMGEGE